jgi:hypothetical protein
MKKINFLYTDTETYNKIGKIKEDELKILNLLPFYSRYRLKRYFVCREKLCRYSPEKLAKYIKDRDNAIETFLVNEIIKSYIEEVVEILKEVFNINIDMLPDSYLTFLAKATVKFEAKHTDYINNNHSKMAQEILTRLYYIKTNIRDKRLIKESLKLLTELFRMFPFLEKTTYNERIKTYYNNLLINLRELEKERRDIVLKSREKPKKMKRTVFIPNRIIPNRIIPNRIIPNRIIPNSKT